MLVLSRTSDKRVVVLDLKTNQEILSVQVLDAVGGQLRLGLDTPPNHRQEVSGSLFGTPQALPR